jgi:negative regulator of flagellin synthesis FlgM
MKIGHPLDNSSLVNTTVAAAPSKGGSSPVATAKAEATKSTQSAGVAVTVSTLARSLGVANQNVSADVDMEKVAAVRTAIQKGTYVVNPEAIADQLLGNAQEMLDRARR